MNKIYLLLITIVSLLIWKPILNQVPMGEGYYYFDRCQNKFIAPKDCPTTIWQYDNLARISFQIMIPLFTDNIDLYMVAQLIIMILLYITIYIVLSKITNHKFFAFAATVTFLSSHTGSFSMMAIGNYQRFVQRVPNLIPLFVSFYYLNKYFDGKKFNNLFISLSMFVFSVFMAHHSIFMLPLFIVYIIIKSLSEKINLKSIVINIVMILMFLGSAFLLTKTDHLAPKMGIINYTLNTPQILEKTILQIPNLLIPTEIVRYIAKNWPILPILYPFTFVLKLFTIPLLFLLLIAFLKAKKNTHLNILFKTSIIALPIVCFLNLYAYGDGAPHPLRDFGEDRIYFIASIYGSIVLGYIFAWLWDTKKRTLKFLSVTLLALSIIYNSYLINRDAIKLYDNSKKMESFINYIKMETADNNVNIAVVGPSHLLWPMQFVTLFYNTNDNLTFALDSSNWETSLERSNFDKIRVLDYVNNKIIVEQIK